MEATIEERKALLDYKLKLLRQINEIQLEHGLKTVKQVKEDGMAAIEKAKQELADGILTEELFTYYTDRCIDVFLADDSSLHHTPLLYPEVVFPTLNQKID